MSEFWWAKDPEERFYFEITRRPDIGIDLRAPLSARGGSDTPGYSLVNEVQKGDFVIHYKSDLEQIVGVSRATGEKLQEPIWWAARGKYARKANVKEQWLPGLRIILEHYQELSRPIPMSEVRDKKEMIFKLRDALATKFPDNALYYPWTKYGDSLRTFQSYLAKFPKEATIFFPEIIQAMAKIQQVGGNDVIVNSDLQQAEDEFAARAGRPRARRAGKSQGFATDQLAKVAVEAHAMNLALEHYAKLGKVIDTSRNSSYDYVVEIDGVQWHVEVKGTQNEPSAVLLTPNEVQHAHDYPNVALFVVGRIRVIKSDSGDYETEGGTIVIKHPWHLRDENLCPTGYKYLLD